METPRFFSKPALIFFTILLSPFFGAVLFAQNLNEIGKKNEIFKVLLLAILWNALVPKLFNNIIPDLLIAYLVANVLGGIVLIFPVWKHYLQEITTFESRPIWGPLIVFIVIIGILVTAQLISR